MESLFGLVETQRILFINVFRPAHKETGDKLVETIRERFPHHYVEIVLQPLDKNMSEALITNMLKLKGLHHAFIDQIVQTLRGQPILHRRGDPFIYRVKACWSRKTEYLR